MEILQSLIRSVFETSLSPLDSVSPIWSLIVISLLTSLFVLVIFKYLADNQLIKQTKNAIKAHVLEIWLFRDDLKSILDSLHQIIRLNGRYFKLLLTPFAVVLIPILLLIMYLEGYFGYRPLLPGETVVLSVHLNSDETELLGQTSVQAYGGVTVDSLPIRIPSKNEISWRIRANDFGKHALRVKINGQRTDKIVLITDKLKHVVPRKATNNLWNIIVNPWESPIPNHLPIEKIVVHYPVRYISMFGIEMNWLVSFVILTIIFGYVFKGLLRVEI